MTLSLVRRSFGAVALLGATALVAACTGSSGSSLLSPTGPTGTLAPAALNSFTPEDPCTATTGAEGFTTNPSQPPDPPPPCVGKGRFTGGGFQINENDVKVTRGFTLHCDAILSNNFEVNWKDADGDAHHFHIEKNPPVVECSLVGNPPNPPVAGVNRIVIADALGKLDGEADHRVTLVLEDHGEPGTADRAYIAVDGVALTGGTVAVPALINGGNIQAHLDQPHKNK